MTALIAWFRAEHHRAYLYRVGTAVASLVGVLGLVAGAKLAAGVVLLGALLSVGGLASANTSTTPAGHRTRKRTETGATALEVVLIAVATLIALAVLLWLTGGLHHR